MAEIHQPTEPGSSEDTKWVKYKTKAKTPWHILFKLLEDKDKEKILKAARVKRHSTVTRGPKKRITSDFP